MKHWKKYLTDIIFLAIIAIILFILLIPWPLPQVIIDYREEPLEQRVQVEPEMEQILYAEPQQVAALFGVVSVAPVPESEYVPPPADTTPEPPQKINWLKYIGYIVVAEEEGKHYFKDTRKNTVIKLSAGQPDAGWSIIEITDSYFLLEYEQKRYIISK